MDSEYVLLATNFFQDFSLEICLNQCTNASFIKFPK